MPRLLQYSISVLLAFVCILALAPSARAQCESGWLQAPVLPPSGFGTDGLVRAVIAWDPDGSGSAPPVLVVAGTFATVGGTTSANNIATWDGATWQPMGSGMTGTGATIDALAVYNNQLIAAGTFTSAGGVAANNIAAWNGSSWQPLSSGLTNGGVIALAVYANQLYATGTFSAAGGTTLTGVARWNGFFWSSAPAGGNGEAYAMAVFNNELYAGGYGNGSPGTVTLYRFNGTSWGTVGPITGSIHTGGTPYIDALTVYNNALVIGGNFRDAGSFTGVNGIVSWNGGAFGMFSSGMNDPVLALTVVGDSLYAGGYFTSAGDVLGVHVSRWTGSNWSGPATSMSGANAVNALCAFNGELITGGQFTLINGTPLNNIGRYNPTSDVWLPVHNAAPIRAMSGAVTAAGDFVDVVNGSTAQHVVSWNGSTLSALNTLNGYTGPNGPIYTIGSLSTGPFTPPVAVFGGSFSSSGGLPANNLAALRSGSWGTLGSGFNGTVRALATYGNALYAAGDFTASGAVSCPYIAKYVSGAWQALAAGGFNGPVYTLFVSNGALYAGGAFTTAGGNSMTYLASFNGSAWSSVGDALTSNGTNSGVYCMTSYTAGAQGSHLVIGGRFTTSFNHVQNLAQQSSTIFSFTGIGGNFSDTVRAATMYEGDLVIGGDFTSTPGGSMNHIARYGIASGDGWQALGTGVDATVYALDAAWQTELHVGGAFSSAGGAPSETWARWNATGAPAIMQPPFFQATDGNCHAAFTIVPLPSYVGLTYQWLRNGVPLVDGVTVTGSVISGSTTDALSLSNLDRPDEGDYSCAVTNACGTTTSVTAGLAVHCCGRADFNHDGDIGTDADIEAFFACLGGHCCPTCGSADFDGDGDVGTDADIEAFFRILAGGAC